jgi:ferric-dicitrate binding protein FerR (iron transport regulator)
VRGTHFTVVADDRASDLEVHEGSVWVHKNDGSQLLVNAGAHWSSDTVSQSPEDATLIGPQIAQADAVGIVFEDTTKRLRSDLLSMRDAFESS